MAELSASSDPLSGEAFEALYETRIRPALEEQESRRHGALNLFAGTALVAALLWVTLLIAAPGGEAGGVFFLVGALLVFISYWPLGFLAAEAKQTVVSALCAPLGISFDASSGDPPLLGRFKDLKLLPHSDDESYEDCFKGRRARCAFELCEASLSEGSGKNRREVFRGQLFAVAFPRRFLGVTVVLRENGWLNRFNRPADMQPVTLEDPAFEKTFCVFGTDQVEARAILTPDFMEKLDALERRFAAGNLRCAFADGQVLIALEGGNRFEIGGMFHTLVDKSRVTAVAADLAAVFGLIDSFAGREALP